MGGVSPDVAHVLGGQNDGSPGVDVMMDAQTAVVAALPDGHHLHSVGEVFPAAVPAPVVHQ